MTHSTIGQPSAARDAPPWYRVYGLTLRSALALPELAPAAEGGATPDIEVELGPIAREPSAHDRARGGCFAVEAGVACFVYRQIGKVEVREGRTIRLELIDDPEPALVRHVVLGVALGVLMHQRGHLTLHASAVRIDDAAVAFVGWKRMGKSTTAAALHAAGHTLLTDDTVVLDAERPGTMLPGFRTLKLDGDAVRETLGLDPASMPPLVDGMRRYLHRLESASLEASLPLRCLFVLDWGDEVTCEPLAPAEAFVELVRHSYAQRFLGTASATPNHFRQVERLVQHVPVARLTKPPDYTRLQDVIAQIEARVREEA